MNETKKPAIRFQGFSDEWKQSRVGELIEDYTEKTVVQNQYPVLTSSQQQGIVRQEEYFADRQVTTNDNVGYFVLPFGYFTYRSRSDTDVFVFNRNDLIDKGIISYYYPVFAPKSCNSNFLLRRLNYGIKKQLSMAAEGTGQKVLAHSKFKGMVVDVPDEEEQIKIGTIFEYVDNLIAKHQSKLEKLQAVKVSMLERLFPKDGADVPEVRFKGFTGAWKKHKLSELCEKTFGGGTPDTANREYWNGSIPWLQSSDISDGQLFDVRPKKYISSDGLSKSAAQLVPKCSIAIVTRVGVGKLVLIPFSYTTSQDFLSLSNLKAEPLFMVYACYKKMASELNSVQGTSIKGITKDVLLAKELFLPGDGEQQKIGEFFRKLDNIIALHHSELDKLQSIKKALLEKMFI